MSVSAVQQKWISSPCTHIRSFLSLPPTLTPSHLFSHPRALHGAPCALQLPPSYLFTHSSEYICQPQSSNSFHILVRLPGPHVHSLCLRLYFWPASSFICTIFLDSTCVCWYKICVSLSNFLHSVWQSLGLSTSLQINPISFLFYDRIIFHCIYAPHLLVF